MEGCIFINYRRDISAASAGRLSDRLMQNFDRKLLFIDVDSIGPGIDFVRALDDQVARCKAFIAVIGPDWANAKNADGERRLDDPHDVVRVEIEAALKRDILVIPVLVDGARMPRADELPVSLQPLLRRNAIAISHHRFGAEVDELVRVLHRAGAMPPVSWIDLLFSFKGRISRKSFWLGSIVVMVALIALTITIALALGIVMFDDEWQPTRQFLALYYLAGAPFLWPSYALVLKRLQDFERGWKWFLPFVGISVLYFALEIVGPMQAALTLVYVLSAIWIVIGCIKGTKGPNKYGPDPLRPA